MELFERLGGGGKDGRPMVLERIRFVVDSGFERVGGRVWAGWIRAGGGRSKVLFVSFSEGRGGRIGFAVTSSCGEVGRLGRSGAICAGGCSPTPFATGFVILFGTGIATGDLIDGGEYFRRVSGGVMNGGLGTICGDRGGGGGGVFGIGSGVFGPCFSSCFCRMGRGDNGGFVPTGEASIVAERGGRDGRVGAGGGIELVSRVPGELWGESTVITGYCEDAEMALRPSVRGVGINCGERGGPSALGLSGGSKCGFDFGLGGGCGEGTLTGRPSIRSINSIHWRRGEGGVDHQNLRVDEVLLDWDVDLRYSLSGRCGLRETCCPGHS